MVLRPQIRVDHIRPHGPRDQLQKTIELVGQGIRRGGVFFPIRQWAAGVASRAAPKDYLGQLRAVYTELLKRWRYVRDPVFAELVPTTGPAIHGVVMGGITPSGIGFGDCDCVTTALGAALSSIGFPVRLVTSIALRARAPGHIYPEVFVKGLNRWIPADPVVFPKHGLGYVSPARARFRWDLFGRPIQVRDHAAGRPLVLGELGELPGKEVGTMYGQDQWQDQDLVRYGYAGLGGEPEDWSEQAITGFGSLRGSMGMFNSGLGLLAEVEPDQYGLARTPMIELSADDFNYIRTYGRPYDGMMALGDEGQVYQYNGLGGFFGKIFGGAKKLIGGVVKAGVGIAKKLHAAGKSLISRLPGGKYLVKVMNKVEGVAMKLVRPLAKIVGPLAKRLAPIAAMLPGYGPLISVGLQATGTLADIMKKHGVSHKKGGGLHFKDPRKLHAFQSDLKKHANAKRAELKAKAKGKAAAKHKAERKKVSPRHLPKGSPEAAAVLRALGIRFPSSGPMIPTGPASAFQMPAAPPAWNPQQPPAGWSYSQPPARA